ncbi:hypothetical protein AAG906_017663 [Vitis piasezkii]
MLGGFGKVELVSTSTEQDETEKNKAPTVDDPVDPNENEDFDVICACMEATQRQVTDAQSHLNSLIASYNHDVKVLRTRFTSSHYRTDEGQPSNCHEHVNESGASFYTNNPQHSPVHSGGQRRSFEDDLGCTNEGVSERPNVEEGVFFETRIPSPGPHNMLVLTEEEIHVDDYVFNESKDPSERLCAYGGYGVTRNNFNEICGSMSKFTSKSTLKKILVIKNSFKQNDVNINNLHPRVTNIVGDPKLCHLGMYAILYMSMSLERLKFATHMVLDSENEIGEMVTTNIWSTNDARIEFTDKLIEEDEFDADQKDAFKVICN